MLAEIPFEPCSPELDRPEDLGTEVETGSFFAQIPDQPIGFSLRYIYKHCGAALPNTLAAYEETGAYKVNLIPHRVSIIRRSGFADIRAVGIEIKYLNPPDRTCSVAGLFPSFEYMIQGQIGIDVNCGGVVDTYGQITPLLETFTSTFSLPSLGAFPFSVSASGQLHLGLKVSTPSVSATGEGSSGCEWRFDKKGAPLFGRTLETWSAVILPKRQKKLSYQARFYFLTWPHQLVPWSTRYQSPWSAPMECPLLHTEADEKKV